jgi:transposase
MAVIIGVDPHKATHTAVAISGGEEELARKKVRSGGTQAEQLVAWAEPFEARTWAIESAGGLGYLLAQQLVAAGEAVVDVPATLASRVRVLSTGRSNKNDPNDALSVAIAATAVWRAAASRGRRPQRSAASPGQAQHRHREPEDPARMSYARAVG